MPYVSHWLREARETIAKAVATLPPDAPMKDKLAAISASYPFGPRKYHPYKQWLKAVREYKASQQPNAPPGSGPEWRETMRRLGYRFESDGE